MTTFSDLPDLGGGLRLVGSAIIDEEQFLTERWHEYRGDWRPTVEGIHRYATLRRERKEERHSSWQQRQDADDEYSDSITELIEKRDKEGDER